MPATFIHIHSPIQGAVFPARMDLPHYQIWAMGSPDPAIDLAVFCNAVRVWTGAGQGQVMAIIEFVNPVTWQVDHVIGRSTFGHEHAEKNAFRTMVNQLPPNTHPRDITARVYVEMEPCQRGIHPCRRFLNDNAPCAIVMYGAPFPSAYTERTEANKRMRDSRGRRDSTDRAKITRLINQLDVANPASTVAVSSDPGSVN